MLLRNNKILCLFYLHTGTSLPVPVSNGAIKCCQTFEHVFSLRTELRYERSNVSCEELPAECASTMQPSMLREFQTATKGGWELPLWQRRFTHDILKCRSV
jgi:hypothetical protein